MQFDEKNGLWDRGIVLSFDFKIDKLRRYYSKESPENAYKVVKNFLLKNGFEHLKDSDYLSLGLNRFKTSILLKDFSFKNKWFPLCIEKLILSPNVESLDVSNTIRTFIDDDFKRVKDLAFFDQNNSKTRTVSDWKKKIEAKKKDIIRYKKDGQIDNVSNKIKKEEFDAEK